MKHPLLHLNITKSCVIISWSISNHCVYISDPHLKHVSFFHDPPPISTASHPYNKWPVSNVRLVNWVSYSDAILQVRRTGPLKIVIMFFVGSLDVLFPDEIWRYPYFFRATLTIAAICDFHSCWLGCVSACWHYTWLCRRPRLKLSSIFSVVWCHVVFRPGCYKLHSTQTWIWWLISINIAKKIVKN